MELNEQTVKDLLFLYMKSDESSTKENNSSHPSVPVSEINTEALRFVTMLSESLVKETLYRAANKARSVGSNIVKVEHLNQILAQMILDFTG